MNWKQILTALLIVFLVWPIATQAQQQSQFLTDYEYGKLQLDAMMKDRPKMKDLVSTQDRIYSWTARQFGGSSCGSKIAWKNDSMYLSRLGYMAESHPRDKNSSAFIRVSRYDLQGKERAAKDLWHDVAFELMNVSNGPQYDQLYKKAVESKYSKEEFLKQATMLEYEADKKTVAIYYYLWLPLMKHKHIDSNQCSWPSIPSTYKSWISQHRTTDYPRDSWGKYYDVYLLPVIKGIVK
ncbi:MAG: hypothetical protein Q8T09_00500 [Candidatus Melainabacteria bacterium]|nr:hypothetical protein [Candidatus Melainabacteria bacterium]